MILSLRNAILLAGSIINTIILILFVMALVMPTPFRIEEAGIGEFVRFLAREYSGDLLLLLLLQLVSLLSSILLYRQFRKTASPEIFFFLLFILSMGIEGTRVFPVVLQDLHIYHYINQLIIRLLYLARFFGVFCLFAAGLFAAGMQYQKLSIAFGISLLTAFTLASLLPVADTAIDTRSGLVLFDSQDVVIVFLSFQGLTVVNFIVAWIKHNSRDYLWLGLASLFVLAGFEAALRFSAFAPELAALGMLVTGIWIFAKRTHEIYLWI